MMKSLKKSIILLRTGLDRKSKVLSFHWKGSYWKIERICENENRKKKGKKNLQNIDSICKRNFKNLYQVVFEPLRPHLF